MKILALTSEFAPFRGGIGTYAAGLARAATELGHEMVLAAPDYGEENGASDRRESPFEIIRYSGGPHRAKDVPGKIALARRLVGQGQFDLVHAMDWPFFLPAALAARRVPRLYSVHGSEIAHMARPTRRLAISATGVWQGDYRVLGVSGFTHALFCRHFPELPPERSGFVHLGVDADWLAHQGKRDDRARLALPGDRLIVLTLARVTRRKGHLAALEALARLPERVRDSLVYVIAGPDCEDDYRRELEAAIAASPADVRRYRGLDRADVMALVAAGDIFCLPGGSGADGQVEGFGLVLLEAGSQGLPLIAGDVGGVAEVVHDGISGLVVPPRDVAALAHALLRLADEGQLRARLGRGARARAESLTWQRCAGLTYGPAAGAR